LVDIMVVWLTPKVKQGGLTAVCRSRRPAGGLHSPGMARIEIERRVLKQNLTAEKIQALQLAPIDVRESDELLVVEGPSIVIARAWITDPEAWTQLAQSVRAGSVRRFDATQLQLADEPSVG
jgi:hypothetical protein